jgi:serine/threonine-protein kinase
VLDGPRGDAIIRACEDRLIILGVVDTLRPDDRALIPDVAPTADSLVDRVASLAQTVHRLDADGTQENLARLDARITELQTNTSRTPGERERHRALLERQRTTVQDLVTRREQLASQLENASIVLANLRLDLIKLRSAGIGSALDDVNTATQEARALSRDISHVLDAAREIRSL